MGLYKFYTRNVLILRNVMLKIWQNEHFNISMSFDDSSVVIRANYNIYINFNRFMNLMIHIIACFTNLSLQYISLH